MRKELFLNKRCSVTYLSGFALEGTVIDIDENGITFRTSQKTSYICWNAIKDIRLV